MRRRYVSQLAASLAAEIRPEPKAYKGANEDVLIIKIALQVIRMVGMVKSCFA